MEEIICLLGKSLYPIAFSSLDAHGSKSKYLYRSIITAHSLTSAKPWIHSKTFCLFLSTFKMLAKSPTAHSNFKNSDQSSFCWCMGRSSLLRIRSNKTLVLLSSLRCDMYLIYANIYSGSLPNFFAPKWNILKPIVLS